METEAVEEEATESQPQTTTPEQQLAIVKRQKQERLRVLAANDPIYQRLDGQDDVLTALTSPSNGKVPDA
ncbi:hypothetical protein [uncultured Mediterranean phage uvDeep-CGR2-KM23-C246]|nr:hypothetical protein [uncultured Mediterranean phage uvDeep-CGR2-KM23-C246]